MSSSRAKLVTRRSFSSTEWLWGTPCWDWSCRSLWVPCLRWQNWRPWAWYVWLWIPAPWWGFSSSGQQLRRRCGAGRAKVGCLWIRSLIMSDPTLLQQLNIHGPDWSWAKFWHHKLEWLRLVKTLRLKIQHDSTVKSCAAPKFDPYRWSNCNLNRSHHNKLRSGVAVHRWWSSHLLWWLGCLAQTMCGGWSVWNPEGWKRMKKGYGDHIHSDIRIYLCYIFVFSGCSEVCHSLLPWEGSEGQDLFGLASRSCFQSAGGTKWKFWMPLHQELLLLATPASWLK